MSEQRTSDPAPRKRLVRRAPREDLSATRAMARTARWARLARWYPLAVAIVGVISLAVMYGVYNAQVAQLKAARLQAYPPAADQAQATSPSTEATNGGTTTGQGTGTASAETQTPAPAPEPDLNTLVWPVTGNVLTPYGWNFSKTMQDWRLHQAIDLKAEEGAPVRAALAGTVVSVGLDPALGYLVVLDHGGGVQSAYGSLKAPEVAVGDHLEQNDYLGKVGTTALTESADGPHLHFALTVKGGPVDPRKYLN
ncbi:MAG: peptidoglycan DD-metalloendopeptidase family protein [Bacillota bacterium]